MAVAMSSRGQLPEPEIIQSTLSAVVQIVALQKSLFGNMSAAWTGSGSIVDPKGIILTNCHVANPRAMGMSSPAADSLGISVIRRSDEPPALTYLAEIVVQSPELDLAVLKITHEVNGKRARRLNLPSLPIGDSDSLELGDIMAIFGYPGIGGDTVTFTSGSVAGFTKEERVSARRAWIKTDATIAGGNSGGTAVNFHGELVAIPTQAAAGANISPVDARPVVDTNRDGRIDQRDTPMAIGGFINGLRPVNLAKPLLRKAGVKVQGRGSRTPVPTTPPPSKSSPVKPVKGNVGIAGAAADAAKLASTGLKGKVGDKKKRRDNPRFDNLVFSARVTRDGRPINPADVIPAGAKQINATFDFSGMRQGKAWGQVWALNGKTVLDEKGKWQDGPKGRKTLVLANESRLPSGEYHLVLTANKQVVTEGKVTIGKRVEDNDTELSGQIVDGRTGQGIGNALVIALKPGVQVMDFVRYQRPAMAFTSTKTDNRGKFTFPQQLPKGQAYGLIVVAQGYQDLAVEGALRITAGAPEKAEINPIAMQAG
ncbi:MAG: trypsin-like peptidase domain-containing protein [Chloroflexota bacterium]